MEHETVYDVKKHDDMNWTYPTSLFIHDGLHIFGQIMHKSSKNKRKSIDCILYPEKLSISKMAIDEANSEWIVRDNVVKSKKKAEAGEEVKGEAAQYVAEDDRNQLDEVVKYLCV